MTMSSATGPAEIPGFEQGIIDVGGVQLAYRVGGNAAGAPVVLWHGFLGTGWTWRKVATILAQRGCAVLIPDMRGYGDSDKPAGDAGYDGASLAKEMRALVAALGFGGRRPLTLVAHDMGAPPALLWAADYPEEISGLAYLDEPVLLPDVLAELIHYGPETTKLGGLWWWMMALAPGMAEALIAGGHERAFLTWNVDHYSAVPGAIEPEAVDEILRSFGASDGVAGAFGVYRAVPRTVQQTTRLMHAKVKPPVLALGGDGSLGNRVRELVERVAEHVQGGSMQSCGHFIPEERPDELVQRLAALVPELRM